MEGVGSTRGDDARLPFLTLEGCAMLDALILVGVAITLLKGVDFVIRPHQRKAIQEFLEDMTLRIDTFNFRDISGKFGTPEAYFASLFSHTSSSYSLSWLYWLSRPHNGNREASSMKLLGRKGLPTPRRRYLVCDALCGLEMAAARDYALRSGCRKKSCSHRPALSGPPSCGLRFPFPRIKRHRKSRSIIRTHESRCFVV